MGRISAEDLRRTTLARQFPRIGGRDATAVLELFHHLGPVQSQVPRAPFVAVSSRLPTSAYEVVRDLFVDHRLLKTTRLRGTVHTTTRADFVRTDAVCRNLREPMLRRELMLDDLAPADVVAELERFARHDWRPRTDIVEHMRAWLAERGRTFEANTFTGNLFWSRRVAARRGRVDRAGGSPRCGVDGRDRRCDDRPESVAHRLADHHAHKGGLRPDRSRQTISSMAKSAG